VPIGAFCLRLQRGRCKYDSYGFIFGGRHGAGEYACGLQRAQIAIGRDDSMELVVSWRRQLAELSHR
jgi:hypothetical protein